jgi:hypothetical protein
MDDELPRDPDLDDLPEELVEQHGPLWVSGVDPDTGEEYEAPVTREQIATGLADRRRLEMFDDK